MQMKDAPLATLLFTEDKVGEEIRKMYYVRREGTAVNKNFIPAYGIATVQDYLWRS